MAIHEYGAAQVCATGVCATPTAPTRHREPMVLAFGRVSTGRFPQLPFVKRPEVDMLKACEHASHMSKMVQIRNVPDVLHRKLKSRAADSGQTLSDFLLAELERLAARPTRDEMLIRIHRRKRVTLKTPAAAVIREERESA